MPKKAPIDKLDIYVSAQHLFTKLYRMRGRIDKCDVQFLYPWILNMALELIKDVALAKRVKNRSIEYIEKMIADFETIKLTLRNLIHMHVIRTHQDKVELFTIIANIDDSLDKWYSYRSDVYNKAVIKRDQEMRKELQDVVTNQIQSEFVKAKLVEQLGEDAFEEETVERVPHKIELHTVQEFLRDRPLFINKKIIEEMSRHSKETAAWYCIYGCSRDDMTKGSVHEISKSIPCLDDTYSSKGVANKYAYIYKYEHGWLCISGTHVKSVVNFLIIGDEKFFKDNGSKLFYDEIDFGRIYLNTEVLSAGYKCDQ